MAQTEAPGDDALALVQEHAASIDKITFTSASGEAVNDLLSCTFIHFPTNPETPIPRTRRTRALRSRNSAALTSGSSSTPDDADDAPNVEDFLPLDALIFLLQTQAEAVGLYAVKATRERVARVDTLDRPGLLDFLTGKRQECEVVLSLDECRSRQANKALAATGDAAAVSTQSGAGDAAAAVAGPSVGAEQDGIALTSGVALHPLLAAAKRPYNPSKQDAAFVKRLRSSEVLLRDRAWAFRCSTSSYKGKEGKRPATNGEVNEDDEDDEDDDDEDVLDTDGTVSLNGNSKSVLRSAGSKDVDFTGLRRSVMGKIAAARSGNSGSASAPQGGTTGSRSGANASGPASSAPTSSLGRSAKHRRLDPILILPSSPSSLLTLSNIKRFLEEGHFDPPSSSNSLAMTGGSNEVVVVNRPKGGRFLAVDSLEALSRLGASRSTGGDAAAADPWRRVVCVITTGQRWQFRGYRWEEGRELFRNVFGVYPRYSNQAKDAGIKDWNVLDLQIDPSRRHLDSQLQSFFWRQMEAWIARRRPDLS